MTNENDDPVVLPFGAGFGSGPERKRQSLGASWRPNKGLCTPAHNAPMDHNADVKQLVTLMRFNN